MPQPPYERASDREAVRERIVSIRDVAPDPGKLPRTGVAPAGRGCCYGYVLISDGEAKRGIETAPTAARKVDLSPSVQMAVFGFRAAWYPFTKGQPIRPRGRRIRTATPSRGTLLRRAGPSRREGRLFQLPE